MGLILVQLTTKDIGYVMPETWASLHALDIGYHIVDLHVLSRNDPKNPKAIRSHHQGYNMERSRQFAVKHGYDCILVVQSDIVFPPETLKVLVEKMKQHNAGVVCPLTPERPEKVKTDNFVVCMGWNGNPHARKAINEGRDFEITGNGSGYMCVLVRKDVFQKVSFPVMGNSDCSWYPALRRAGVKIVCEVSLRIGHKQRSDGAIIRGDVYVTKHWRDVTAANIKKGRPWFYGLPGKFWRGRTREQFLEQLPKHINENRAFWSW